MRCLNSTTQPRIAGASASTSKKPASKKAPVTEDDEEKEEEAEAEEEEEEGPGRIVVHTSLEGDKYVDLGKKKRASVRVFKGAHPCKALYSLDLY